MPHYRNAAEDTTFALRRSWSVTDPIINIKIFPLAVFACQVVVVRTLAITTWVLSYFQYDPDKKHFSLHLCMTLSYSLHKVVDSTELYACLNGVSLNIESPIILTPLVIMTPQLF